MFKNYFVIILRNLWRNPDHSLINVFGLSVGMAVCLLTGLYIENELSFDRFHEKEDRLFVIAGNSLTTPYSLATVLESVPDVEQTTRFWIGNTISITPEKKEELQVDYLVLLAEPSFFEVFSFPSVIGNASTALTAPDAVIITESMAQSYFGSENPVGKSLEFQRLGPGNKVNSMTINAVVKDPPPNSSIQFDLIAPLSSLGPQALQENSWGFDLYETFVLTKYSISKNELSVRITEAIKHDVAPDTELTFSALPFSDLHLSGLTEDGFKSKPKYIYIFGTMAFLVLLIAVVNYINLITARATRQTKEIGVRKAIGAGRFQIICQFLIESVMLSTIALFVSLCLVKLALPAFNDLFGKKLTFWGSEYNFVLPLLAGIVVLLTILASIYPAFVSSYNQPTKALYSAGNKTTPFHIFGFRKSLVMLQFTISVGLIIGTVVIYRQLKYVQNKNLGFNGEQIMVVQMGGRMSSSVRESFRERILSHQGIVSATMSNAVPDRFHMGYTRPVNETAPQSQSNIESVKFRPAVIDYDFIPTLQIKVLAGRNFSREFPTDVSHAYIINKAASELLGWSPDEAVGKTFKLGTAEVPEGEIIGVVDNFHIESLHQKIEPVVLQLHTLSPVGSMPFILAARIAPDQIQNAIKQIRQEFNQIAPPGTPFWYFFLDDHFEKMYLIEEQTGRIFTLFAVLALFISCLGLFAISQLTVISKTKEIALRKINGARVSEVLALLNQDFIKWVVIAFIIAAPVAYYAMYRWLESFAYKTNLSWWIFALAGLLALGIALLTVSWQSWRAATRNPVEALRYE